MVYSSVLVFSSDFLCLAFLVGLFSDGENRTRKPRLCGKRTFYLFLGVNAVFQFMRISVIGASLNCFTIFYLHCSG